MDDRGASLADGKDVSTYAHMFGCWETLNIIKAGMEASGYQGPADRAKLIEAVEAAGSDADMLPPRVPVWERVPIALAEQVFNARAGMIGVIGFFGQILIGFGNLIRHPSQS